jgi:hypothetical protein
VIGAGAVPARHHQDVDVGRAHHTWPEKDSGIICVRRKEGRLTLVSVSQGKYRGGT